MDTLVSVLQRLEAKLDAIDSLPSASRPPRPDPYPPYGLSWEWQSPSGTPASLATHSVEVSVPPWSSSTLPASSWLQAESFRHDFHEPISGMGLHTSGLPPHNSWDPPWSRIEEFQGQCSSWNTTAAFPSSWDPPATRMETRGPSSPYEFDPILGRPRTSWDLPSPRFESYGGGGSSQYEYGASGNHGGESYAPYSHYDGGYSSGGYANERNPYAPPPPPPRDSYYVPAPQPNPLHYTHPQQPWESPWAQTAPDSFHTLSTWDQSSTQAHGTIVATEEEGVNQVACAESETGVVDGVDAPVSDEPVGSEEGGLSMAENKEESLCTAAQNGELEIVNSFIAAGADVTYSDTEGLTPLMHTAVNGCTEVLKAPLDGGASGNALPPSNVSAGDFDMENNHQSAFDVLLNAGSQAELVFETTTRNENAKGHASGDYLEELDDAVKVTMGPRGRHASKLTEEEENVARGRIDLKFYALEEVYKDF